jgi:hypothetical protein
MQSEEPKVMKRLTALVLILSLTSLGAQERPLAKDYPQDGVYWATDWSEGLAEANTRNVPIHLVYLDDSEAGIELASKVYADRRFIEASRMWVNLPWHPGKGHDVDAEVGGKRVTVCPRFWNLPCAVHQRNAEFFGEKGFKVTERPTIIFMKGDLGYLGRLSGKLSVADILKAQDKVISGWTGDASPWPPGSKSRRFNWKGTSISKRRSGEGRSIPIRKSRSTRRRLSRPTPSGS